MCFSRPKPPALPEPEPVDSAIEDTADKVVIGQKRKQLDSPKKKKNKMTPVTGGKGLGTASLQIPLLTNKSKRKV